MQFFGFHCVDVNCVDLKEISTIFDLICKSFLPVTNNQDCQRSRKTLQLLIEDRPEDIAQINQKIKQVFKSTNEPGANEEESEDDESVGICFLNTRQAKAVPNEKL